MHILMYKSGDKDGYCSIMGIFFTKKGAKKARDKLRKDDYNKYPNWPHRPEQKKASYTISEHKPFKVKKHKDPYQGK